MFLIEYLMNLIFISLKLPIDDILYLLFTLQRHLLNRGIFNIELLIIER